MKLRLALLALAIPFGSVAVAQVGVLTGQGFGLAARNPLFPPHDQQNPTQPSGFPLPPVQQTGDLPQPEQVGPEGGGLRVLRIGKALNTEEELHFTDGVEFTKDGYHVWADEARSRRGSNIYTLKGNVVVVGRDESVYGDEVTVNFTDKTFVALNSKATLKPSLVRGRILDNVYTHSRQSSGSEKEIFLQKSSTTTCSYPEPHYEILADKVDVRPGKRIIFRKVRLKLLGHTLVTLPFLSIPLDQRNYNNLPEVGRGQAEGFFIKNRFGVPLTGNDSLNLRTDYYTKLGTGLGAQYRYDRRDLLGYFQVYTITGHDNELEIVNQHRQLIGRSILSIDNTFERNNYLISPGNTVWNSRSTFLIPQGRSNTRLTYSRSSNEGTSSNSLNQTFGVNDQRYYGSKFQTTLDVNTTIANSNFGGGNPVHREQVDLRFSGLGDFNKFQARLDYIRSIPIGETSNFFSSSDITPSLALLTDSRRLIGANFDKVLPFKSELSIGEYGDPIGDGRITRSNFSFDFTNPRVKPSRLQILYQAGFRQGIYSDDTAQYVLRAGSQISYKFTRDTALNIRYSYLRPYGYSPLQIDRTGRTHVVNSDLSFSPLKNLTLGAQTGYDFNIAAQGSQTAWQQVGLRGEYKLGRYFDFRTLSTYDTTRHTFSTTRFDLTYVPGSTFISIGAKYDGLRAKWAAVNLFVDGFQIGRLRTSTLLNYNGYLKRFEAAHFSFIYDLHCAEAVFQIVNNPYAGSGSGNQIVFFIRLKALPFDTPFGTGRQGQAIGTGTGRD